MARPPILADPDRAERITSAVCEALRQGSSMAAAASAGGISDATIFEWVARGREDEAAGRDTVWAEFAGRVAHARREAEDAAVAVIQGAALGWTERTVERTVGPDGEVEREVVRERRDWRAAAWWLERSLPSRWGAQQTHVVEHRAKTWNVPGLVLPGSPEALEEAKALAEAEGGRVQPEGGDGAAEELASSVGGGGPEAAASSDPARGAPSCGSPTSTTRGASGSRPKRKRKRKGVSS